MKNVFGEILLKKVFLILSHGGRLYHFLGLVAALQEKNIECEAMLAEEEYPIVQEALYLTDSGEVLAGLVQQGVPVAVYLHESNRGQDLSVAKYAFEAPECLDVVYLERVYRRCKKIPWDILETERCFLRETTVEDVDAFFEIYAEEEVTRYTEKLYENKESECIYIREYIKNVYEYFEFGIWTVVWKETGKVIGRAGLNVREGYDLPELGYVIGLPWQGKGIASEVCRAILEYAYTEYEFEKIMTFIQRENLASVGLAEKLGFHIQEEILMDNKEFLLMIVEKSK